MRDPGSEPPPPLLPPPALRASEDKSPRRHDRRFPDPDPAPMNPVPVRIVFFRRMWTCSSCGESVEDTFNACWKCGTSSEGVPNPEFRTAGKLTAIDSGPPPKDADPISCPRCNRMLDYVGRKRFHEGTNWGFFGELGELFVRREHFDVYVCPRCGRVEFFVDGIGEEYRPH